MSELQNFVNKFHQLRQAGFTAHLDVDAHAGKSWVALRVMLGSEPIKRPKHRSPSYQKRQERRRAARLAAVNSSGECDAVKASEAQITEEVSDAVKASEDQITEEVSGNSEVVNNDSNKTEEDEANVYNCELCDFISNKKSGLNIHMSRKHTMIEQLDGNVDVVLHGDEQEERKSEEEEDEECDNWDPSTDPDYEPRITLTRPYIPFGPSYLMGYYFETRWERKDGGCPKDVIYMDTELMRRITYRPS